MPNATGTCRKLTSAFPKSPDPHPRVDALQAMTSVNVVVLAGGINKVPLFDGYEPGPKALLPVCGRPLLEYTLDALRGIPQVRRVCVVGPERDERLGVSATILSGSYEFAPGGRTLLDSISSGVRQCRGTPYILVVTADTPLLTRPVVEEFLTTCRGVRTPYPESVFLSMVPARCFTGMFRRVAKRFSRFRDVTVCHGNLALVTPGVVEKASAPGRLNTLYAARKSVVRSALAVGWQVGLSYLFGVHFWPVLTMERMSRIVSRRFGVGLIPVILERPEVAIDVDEPSDYCFVSAQLMARNQPASKVAES